MSHRVKLKCNVLTLRTLRDLLVRRVACAPTSAYGVDAVLLWNGYDNVNWPSSDSLDEVYLGANNPSVSFDNSHQLFA